MMTMTMDRPQFADFIAEQPTVKRKKRLNCSDQRNDEIADLLEENNDPSWRVVILGVGPDQADDVHHWLQMFSHILEVRLLHVFEV